MGKEISRDVYKWKFRTSKLLLNPIDFLLLPEDEYFIITSREEIARDITEKWIKQYCPTAVELIMLDDDIPDMNAGEEEVRAWIIRMAESKAKVIKEKKIEIYIDDSPTLVKKLRELCPEAKIVLYGGRIR